MELALGSWFSSAFSIWQHFAYFENKSALERLITHLSIKNNYKLDLDAAAAPDTKAQDQRNSLEPKTAKNGVIIVIIRQS
jgi:hypothetical protein